MEQTTDFNTLLAVTIELSYDDINQAINFTGLNQPQSLDILNTLRSYLEEELHRATDLLLQNIMNGEEELYGELGSYLMSEGKIVANTYS
jgi:hypothetical protein